MKQKTWGTKVCRIEGCGRRSTPNDGLCQGHWKRSTGEIPADRPILVLMKNSGPCCVPECRRKSYARGYCASHYERVRSGRDPNHPKPIMPPEPRDDREDTVSVTLRGFALEAVKRRSETSQTPASDILRALVERWAMTEGAATQQEQDHTEEAWRRNGHIWSEA